MNSFKLIAFCLLAIFDLSTEPKQVVEIGSNTYVAIAKNKFIAVHEVSNREYQNFLSSKFNCQECASFDNGWDSDEIFNKSYYLGLKEFYSNRKEYQSHPVINVKQIGGVKYCQYLTEKFRWDNPFGKSIVFRLPSKSEWIKASRIIEQRGLDSEQTAFSPPFRDSMIIEMGWDREPIGADPNFFNSAYARYITNGAYKQLEPICPVDYYIKERPILLNMFGNVSEWIEEGTAIGGNWMSDDPTEVTQEIESDSYSPLIGFRVLVEVIDN
jgi:formylglycine-generating enzyme required for sulfatase activity